MAKKVYLVLEESTKTGLKIMGVYADEDDAQAEADSLMDADESGYRDYTVEDWRLIGAEED